MGVIHNIQSKWCVQTTFVTALFFILVVGLSFIKTWNGSWYIQEYITSSQSLSGDESCDKLYERINKTSDIGSSYWDLTSSTRKTTWLNWIKYLCVCYMLKNEPIPHVRPWKTTYM